MSSKRVVDPADRCPNLDCRYGRLRKDALRCPMCRCLVRQPARRRPTDTARLDFLMRHLKRGGPLEVDLHSRRGIDRLMREEAKRG